MLRQSWATGFDWAQAWKPVAGEEVSGRLEAIEFHSGLWVVLLKIGKRWVSTQHMRLGQQIRELEPEIGDELHIRCLGREDSSRRPYLYEITLKRAAA